MCISMGLSLHHIKCLLILFSFSMHRTRPDQHLLVLMMTLALHILLVLHILIMIILLFLMHYHLHMLVEFQVLLVNLTFPPVIMALVSAIDQVRLDGEVFLMSWFDIWLVER